MDQNKTTISVTSQDERKLVLTFLASASIYEYIDEFKVILKWLTFPDELIEKALPDEDSTYRAELQN